MKKTIDGLYLSDLPYWVLDCFSRAELRKFAHELDIEIGQNKVDTIKNLKNYPICIKLKLAIN